MNCGHNFAKVTFIAIFKSKKKVSHLSSVLRSGAMFAKKNSNHFDYGEEKPVSA